MIRNTDTSALLKLCFHIDALGPWDLRVHPGYRGEVLDGRDCLWAGPLHFQLVPRIGCCAMWWIKDDHKFFDILFIER